ncbi:MAG: hypothetical protein KAT68_05300 [Bacteroidales bacterium]|nr:hypothetical protein [Bacteroidales bacterium]
MASVKNIKLHIGKFVLKKKLKKHFRNRQSFNLDTAKSIGIIFNISNEKYYPQVKELVNTLSKKDIEILALGYSPSKDVPDKYLFKQKIKFFSNKDLNWINFPISNIINQFINKDYDIMIDLSMEKFFPVDYIMAISNAKFKVGKFTEKNNYCDFMIDIKKNDNIEYLSEQIIHYLSNINKY